MNTHVLFVLSWWKRVWAHARSTLCYYTQQLLMESKGEEDNAQQEKAGGEEDHDPLTDHPQLPISFPLTSLHQLLHRSYYSSFHYPYNKASVPLPPTFFTPSHRPRLLACHDLKGGYQDDKWVQGNSNAEAYSLWHWNCLDVFVYFSHNLVSLPPPGWINAAHLHGVQVLGTFITEWDEGAKICQELLESEESAQTYASLLAELAQKIGFDGWLINIENIIAPDQIGNLIKFVEHLTSSMHNLVPGSLIIWYDAVTIDGKLAWQNCLNHKNDKFFDACDGIFINYTWQEAYAKASATAAKDRAFDVFMGVDVFGRNTFGGGGYNSDLALQVALKTGVSAALFAPSWTYETRQPPNIWESEDRWWETIEACWNYVNRCRLGFPFFSAFNQGVGKVTYVDGVLVSSHPWSNLSCQNLQPLVHLINKSPGSSFRASVSSEEAVYDGGSSLRFVGDLQNQEICIIELFPSEGKPLTASLYFSYSVLLGESSQLCLVLKLQGLKSGSHFIFLTGEDSVGMLKEEAASKQDSSPTHYEEFYDIILPKSCKLVQNISMAPHALRPNSNVEKSKWWLREYTLELHKCSLTNLYAISHVGELDHKKALGILAKSDTKKDEVLLSPAERTREVPSNRKVLSETAPHRYDKERNVYHALLGHIRATLSSKDCVLPSNSHKLYGASINWSQNSTVGKSVSLELSWSSDIEGSLKDENSQKQELTYKLGHFSVHYNIYFQPVYSMKTEGDSEAFGQDGIAHSTESCQYLGAAFVKSFYVDHLAVPDGCRSLLFCLQACCKCGLPQDLKESPQWSLEVRMQG